MNMPVTLYRRQKELLDFISQYIQKNRSSPTLQEIADALGLSSLATVHEHLVALEKKKIIKRYEGAVRGIELLGIKAANFSASVEIPLVGYIAAGRPIEAIENPTETIQISPEMISGRKRNFVLMVKGNSMIEDGILDGDYVVVEQQETADNGDIVVAILEDGFATLKRFFREPTRIRLEPANSAMAPIFARNVKIQGRIVGLIRKYHS